ncbi:hypothetical protein E2C01_056218 [Portunus trituberculatus]|uniref:Uncharacterized protein n=1 Tax=Portunus trituberculatus TaxID=210409 RepID=A0A5B7GXJ0_PORTR|nr:hypothetical protein [Portunus trituberculatus]
MSLLAVRYIPQPFQTLRALLDDSATTMIWEYGTASVNRFRVALALDSLTYLIYEFVMVDTAASICNSVPPLTAVCGGVLGTR